MLHLNAKAKKLRAQPVKPKVRADRKFELKMAREPPPKLVSYDYGRYTVAFPWL